MANKFKITVWGPEKLIEGVPIMYVSVYYIADNSFMAFQYAKAVAADYFGTDIAKARYTIEEQPA